MKGRISLLLLAALPAAAGGQTEIQILPDSMQRGIDYVRSLELACTLTDGYVCADPAEESFLLPESWGRMIPGVYLAAWQAVHDDFRHIPELTDEQKDLRHYKIGFTESGTLYIVVIRGIALPFIDESGEPRGITSAVFGRSAKYWVDKGSNRIVKRLFFK